LKRQLRSWQLLPPKLPRKFLRGDLLDLSQVFHAPLAHVRAIILSVAVRAWAEPLPHALAITRSAQVPVWGAQRQVPVRRPQVQGQMVVYRVHLGRRPIQVGGQPAPGVQVALVARVVALVVPVDLFHGVRVVQVDPVAQVDPVGLPVDQVLQVAQAEAPGVRVAPAGLVVPAAQGVSPVGQGRAAAALLPVRSGVRVGGLLEVANPSALSVKSSTICRHLHLVGCASRGVLAKVSGYLGEQA
jgi:hypothetical protein